MKPVEFKGHNTVYAKDQPQYLQLPAYFDKDGQAITEWDFSPEERLRISNGENLRISVHTFNSPLQPMRPYLASLIDQYEEEEQGKKSNAYSERKCGDEPKIEQPLIYTPDAIVSCECGKRVPLDFARMVDDCWTCPSCLESMISERVEKLEKRIDLLKSSGFPSEHIPEKKEVEPGEDYNISEQE